MPDDAISPSTTGTRIDELESIRGIAALLVVLYHIPNWNIHLYGIGLIRNSYLMVNLFFVLSGFVIYKAYANNIHGKSDLLRFQFLRLGRLYPVHFVFLMFFFLLEIAKYVAFTHYGIKSSKTTPFVENSMTAFVQQLLLLQAVGPTGNALTFNAPAWSISVEFYTYLLFALIALHAGRMKTVVFALLALTSCAVIGVDAHNGYFDLLQCLAGFFIGCCTAYLSEQLTVKLPPAAVTLVVILLALYLQCKTFEQYDLMIYLLTAALVLTIVLSDDGAVKRFLRLRVFRWLGMISYSIYMTHSALLWLTNQVQRFVFKRPEVWFGGRLVPQLTVMQTLVSYIVIFAVLLFVSNFVYHRLEKPMREMSRRVAFKLPPLPLPIRWIK